MAENYMQMLDMGLRHTEQVFGRIDEAVTKSFALQENRRQAEAELELKGTQFAAEMAFNDKQLNVEQQKNIMLAQHYKLQDEMQAARFREEMKLQPLKAETARMDMEASRINRMTAFTKAKEAQFSSLVGNIDAVVAGRVAELNDPALAEAYMALRSQEAASIGAGNAYNEAAFSGKVKSLVDGYIGKPLEGYNEVVASSLSKISPSAAARYGLSNPANAPSLFALENQAITGGDKGWHSYAISLLAKGYSKERTTQLGQAKQGYEADSDAIERYQNNLEKLYSARLTADGSRSEEISKEIEDLHLEISKRDSNRKRIYSEAMGITVSPDPITPEAKEAAARELEENAAAARVEKERQDREAGKIKGIITRTPVNPADKDSPLKEQQQLIGDYTRAFPKAFGVDDVYADGNFSFNHIYGTDARKSSKAHAAPLVKNILSNLKDVPAILEKDGDKSVMELIKEPAFAQIFENLKGKSVTVDHPLSSMTNPNDSSRLLGGIAIGNRSLPKFIDQGIDFRKSEQVEIESVDDFINAIRESGFEGYEQKLFIKKLYASVLAAGAIDRLSNSGQ